MQAAHQPPAGDLGQDVAQAVVGIAGRGRVVEGQQRAGEGLHQKQEQRHAAEHLMPAARRRNLLVEEIADRGLDARAVIEPDRAAAPSASCFWPAIRAARPSSSLPFSILVS